MALRFTVQAADIGDDLTSDASWRTYITTDDAALALYAVEQAGRRLVPPGYPRSRWQYRAVRILDGDAVIVTDYPLDLDQLADVRDAVDDAQFAPDEAAVKVLDALDAAARRLLRL